LVLDAGDAIIRDQSPATATRGASSIEAMNLMGYDAMVLGEGDLAQLPLDVIQARIQQAQFPVLSANAYISQTGELIAEPYHLVEIKGHTIAIIGVTGAAHIPDVDILPPLTATIAAIDRLGQQADIVILLSHAGLETNREIAERVPEIDLVISGGGMAYTPSPVFVEGGTPIVHADISSLGHAGRRIGVGTWTFDPEGELVQQQWNDIVLDPTYLDDPVLAEWASDNE